MKTIRLLMTTIAVTVLFMTSGCGTLVVSPEVEKLSRPIKVSLEISLLPGVTLPEEDLAAFKILLPKAMREHGGGCYVYTDQKETADVLVSVVGTDTYRSVFGKELKFTLGGEITHGKKEIFKFSGGWYSGGWVIPTWPSHSDRIAIIVKYSLCKGKG